jgi:dTDP-glucose 4,6-dehydratase
MMLTNKNVLVTGSAGFIGSHLTERLVELGARVRAFVHYNFSGSCGWLEKSRYKNDIEFFFGDITDYDSVHAAMEKIDIVFHLAALISIPYSYAAPGSFARTNIIGTLNVLQAARKIAPERVIHTSTSEVYGTAQYAPIDEKHPLQGQSPYSASKIGADKLCESFYCSYDLPVVTVRPFNTFGPRQSTRAIIPTIIGQCLTGNVINLGNVDTTRDLNYVLNTVDGFVKASASDKAIGKVINLGSGKEISIRELVKTIGQLMGREITIQSEESKFRPDKSEVYRLIADNGLAKELLGWEPRINLAEGLSKTIEWMRQTQDAAKSVNYK